LKNIGISPKKTHRSTSICVTTRRGQGLNRNKLA